MVNQKNDYRIEKVKKAGEKINRKKETPHSKNAKFKSFRIAAFYFALGCCWILFTDSLTEQIFPTSSDAVTFSIFKGLLYVLITALLIFWLVYPPMKKALKAKEVIEQANIKLEQSNQSYRELNEELDRKQALLRSLINSVPDLIFYKDPNSVYLGCNKAFEEFAGKSECELVGLTDLDLFDPKMANLFRKMDQEMLSEKTPRRNEALVTYPNGKKVCLETLKAPYFDMDGNTIGIIGVSRDITERKEKEHEIQYLNRHDALTGLYNRAYFQSERAHFDSPEYLPLSIIVGDINGMKLINDAFGHAQGDLLLVEIAKILKQCSRPGDIVARIGGDEFSILLPNTDMQTTKEIVDQIRSTCQSYHLEKGLTFPGIALGYASKTNPDSLFDATIILAEDLMYRRKLLEDKGFHSSILASIKTTMLEKSNETEEHAERMVKLSKELGKSVGLSEEKLDELELVATLHDIGKISIDQRILTKAGELSDEEWHEIKKHPEVGYRIVNSSPELRHIAEYILCHHERWDGQGYPQGLADENIPLIARIIAIVDAYDAMTEDRSYRKAISHERALQELKDRAGTQFDPILAKIFVEQVIGHQN